MRKFHSLVVPAMLVATISFFVTSGSYVRAFSTGCPVCIPNGCNIDPNEWLVPGPVVYVDTCVDFDGIPPGHCALTERQEKAIWGYDPVFKTKPVQNGFCYKMVCDAAKPDSTRPCDKAWVSPSVPTSSASFSACKASDTCSMHGE